MESDLINQISLRHRKPQFFLLLLDDSSFELKWNFKCYLNISTKQMSHFLSR